MPELTPAAQSALPDSFMVEIADLSETGQAQVIDALNAVGDIDQGVADRALAAAQEADDHRETIGDLREARGDAIADGDVDAAAQYAQDIVWELEEVRGAGGDVDAELIVAEQDLAHHQQAVADTDAANELAGFAANQGSPDAAATSLDSAASYSDAAADELAQTSCPEDGSAAAEDGSA